MIFQDIFVKKPSRSLFNLSHERKFSCDWSGLYPFLVLEVVPGDTFRISTEMIVRTAPLVSPLMHRVDVKCYYFFVPNRLLFKKWEDFITGVDQTKAYVTNEGYFVNPVLPYFDFYESMSATNDLLADGTLADYLTFPTHRPDAPQEGTVRVPMLPFAAYQKIYDDWFRNQNVEEPHLPSALGEGAQTFPVAYNMMRLRRKMWEKDYFTSALPFAQRGDPVDIPISVGSLSLKNDSSKPSFIRNTDPDTDIQYPSFVGVQDLQGVSTDSYKAQYGTAEKETGSNEVVFNSEGFANIDITGHTTVDADTAAFRGTINDLRIATRLQRWLEKNARAGGRYIEQILAHFGVKSSDARLQRAEFLGSFTNPFVIEPVEQQSASQWATGETETTATPQGTLAGKATSYGQNRPIKCYCEEHGFIMGIMTILPRTTYQDGLSKMWQRSNRYDFYFPEFAHLGEQEVNKAELLYNISDDDQRSTDRFGFQERYCEYKYIPSTVHGNFKGDLSFWHLGRQFSSQPALNLSFVQSMPRTNIFAVESGDHFFVNLLNNVQALRPMPKQAIPTL